VLHAKGQRTVALQVLRVLSRAPLPSPDTPLAKLQQEGEAGLCVRLSCGLLPEAFMALREHCARAPPALRPASIAFLVRCSPPYLCVSSSMPSSRRFSPPLLPPLTVRGGDFAPHRCGG